MPSSLKSGPSQCSWGHRSQDTQPTTPPLPPAQPSLGGAAPLLVSPTGLPAGPVPSTPAEPSWEPEAKTGSCTGRSCLPPGPSQPLPGTPTPDSLTARHLACASRSTPCRACVCSQIPRSTPRTAGDPPAPCPGLQTPIWVDPEAPLAGSMRREALPRWEEGEAAGAGGQAAGPATFTNPPSSPSIFHELRPPLPPAPPQKVNYKRYGHGQSSAQFCRC